MNIEPGTASVVVAAIAAAGTLLNTRIAAIQGRKITETHKQVTVNHHSSDFPTVLDRIADVQTAVLDVRKDVNALGTEFNTHVAHSNRMDQRLIKIELARDTAHEIRLTKVESEVSRSND